jgi:hypothetical protein
MSARRAMGGPHVYDLLFLIGGRRIVCGSRVAILAVLLLSHFRRDPVQRLYDDDTLLS